MQILLRRLKKHPFSVFAFLLLLVFLISLTSGRYPLSIGEIFEAVYQWGSGGKLTDRQDEILFLLTDIRLPRICAAILVGAALSVSGTVYQAMFVNPLVSPSILGVLSGASFGAALGIVVFNSWFLTQFLAFAFACAAVSLAVLFSLLFRRSSILVLILGGMVVGAFFTSLTSLLKYAADPDNQLPELVYWLMGSFTHANNDNLLKVGVISILGIVFLSLQGKTVNILSLGDEEAMSLGVNVKLTRIVFITAATFISASTVVLAGTISWVGLVVPHMLRFLTGPDNRKLLPLAAMGGALYMLSTDLMVRTFFAAELPVGIITSLVSLPLFIFAIVQNRGRWR
ncbi:MAG: iron ABC transporter permease [Deferribacteraceae bacterium]|jgi:iron complex transport system permease protein|nr:iron ABC transporter permease [Deferribacteraceae bacterium]